MKTHNVLKTLLALIAVFTFQQLRTQTTIQYCPFDSVYEARIAADPLLQQHLQQRSSLLHNSPNISTLSTNPLVIPVVVHIIHRNTEAIGQGINLPYAQVLSQIDRMNADFANDTIYTQLPSGQYAVNVGIQFCLARIPAGPTQWTDSLEPGVMRYAVSPTNTWALNQVYSQTYFRPNDTLLAYTHPTTAYFPYADYLNIWTVNQITDSAGIAHYGGFAPTPLDFNPNQPIDGIVMDAHMFGDNTVNNNNFSSINPNYNSGNICTHEAGHYLGLYHTFTGGCAGMNANDCLLYGDYICDTPPNTNQTASCTSTNTCTESYFTSGPPDHDDMRDNYMSWVDDNCMTTFTYEQGLVMQNSLLNFRSNLVSELNLSLTGVASPTGCLPPQLLAPIYTPGLICINTPVTFSTPSGPGFTAVSWQWQFSGGSPATSTAQNPSVTWLTPGQYWVVLTAQDSSNNSISDSVSVYVSPCAALASEQGIWYFGRKAGVSFATGVAVHEDQAEVNNTIQSGEGVVSVCDTAGSLIFYSNGYDVWDRNHNLAIGGLVAHNAGSKTQILTVPHPLHPNWYYLFHGTAYEDYYRPVYYSLIADSNGTMIPISLNDTLPTPPGCLFVGEAICAVPHCNGRDYWVITRGSHPVVNSMDIWTQRLFVYLISPLGITNPSGVGQLPGIFTLTSGGSSVVGSVKGSPDNQHLVVSHYYGAGASVLDFDNSTGTISNDRPFGLAGSNYGCSFSPDSRIAYVTDLMTRTIFAVDITQSSLTPVTVASGFTDNPGSLQLGPDSLLYISEHNKKYLHMFTNPNNISNPGYVNNAVQLNTTYNLIATRLGLPNMIDGHKPAPSPLSFTVSFQNCSTVVCAPDGCWGVPYDFSWNFGDNTPVDTNATATHTYSASGQYTISLTISIGSYTFPVIQQPINVMLTTPVITGPSSTCASQLGYITYSAPPNAQSYQWSVTGGGTIQGVDTLSSCNVYWTGNGIVICTINNGSGCSFTPSLIVTVHPNPVVDAGPDTAYACIGGYFQLGGSPTASGGAAPYQYLWLPSSSLINPSVSNPFALVTGPATYTVIVTDTNGCTGSDVIFIEIDSSLIAPVVSFSALPQLCDNVAQIDLTTYVSPTGGSFSGSGVNGNYFDPSLASVPDSNTVYYLYVDQSSGCATLDSSSAYVYQCCNYVATGINTSNGQASSSYGPQFNAFPVTVRINGTFYVNNTFTISNYSGANDVGCAPDATIVVKQGARLILDNASDVNACSSSDSWKGIIIESGGELEVRNGSIIRESQLAIHAKPGAKYTLDGALLRDNFQNVVADSTTGTHPGTIVRTTIQGATLSLAPHAGQNTWSCVEINNVDTIRVGVPGPVADENKMVGAYFGIIADSSEVFAYNNYFNNIVYNQANVLPGCCATSTCQNMAVCSPPPKGTPIWATASKMHVGESTSTNYQNRFRSCTRGVLLEKKSTGNVSGNNFTAITGGSNVDSYCIKVTGYTPDSVIIEKNVMDGIKNGIQTTFNSNALFRITGNRIDNYSQDAIKVLQSNQCPTYIFGNYINVSGTSDGKNAIRVQNAVVTNNTKYVFIQGNTTYRSGKHIWTTNAQYVTIDSTNIINFPSATPPSSRFGIQVQNGAYTEVKDNLILKATPAPTTDTVLRERLYGISMHVNCYNTLVKSNSLVRVGTGIQYVGSNNFPSAVRCNSLNNNMAGIRMNNSFIGDQGAPVSTQNPNGIVHDNTFTFQGTVQRTFYRNLNDPTLNWHCRANMSSSPTSNPNPATMYPPGGMVMVSAFPNAPDCGSNISNLQQQQQLAQIAMRSSPFDSLTAEQLYMADQTVIQQLIADPSLMNKGTPEDSILQAFYEQDNTANMRNFVEVQQLATVGDVEAALSINSNVNPANCTESAQKTVYDIYLRSWAQGIESFTAEDSLVLFEIAYQSPFECGTAVYDARVMLDLDIDDLSGGEGRIHSGETPAASSSLLYPNPTTGDAIYQVELSGVEDASVQVCDVLGQPVFAAKLKNGQNIVTISASSFASGVYIYRTVVNGVVVDSGKLVVTR